MIGGQRCVVRDGITYLLVVQTSTKIIIHPHQRIPKRQSQIFQHKAREFHQPPHPFHLVRSPANHYVDSDNSRKIHLRTSNPCITSPCGSAPIAYSCSLAINFRMQPTRPSWTGSVRATPVMFPVPPKKTGSRNVIREKRPWKIWMYVNVQIVITVWLFWRYMVMKIYHIYTFGICM